MTAAQPPLVPPARGDRSGSPWPGGGRRGLNSPQTRLVGVENQGGQDIIADLCRTAILNGLRYLWVTISPILGGGVPGVHPELDEGRSDGGGEGFRGAIEP